MTSPRLICIIGAESTGKTTLARLLAAHFRSFWVPEYLREFCALHDRTPTREEQAQIIETQQHAVQTAQQKASEEGAPFVFCDTAPLLTAIYSDFIFGDAALYARARSLHAGYALTLLLAPDIAWVADGLQRDGEQVRGPVTQMIVRELAAMTQPVATVAGQGAARLNAAIEAVKALTEYR
jgi:nicotinamide riboside kinase